MNLDYKRLYNEMVGCDKCNNTGYIDEDRCSCFLKYAHKIVCLYAGFSEAAIAHSLKLKLPKDVQSIPFENMIRNGLGLMVVGDIQQIQSYICYSIWKDIEIFTRYNSTQWKSSIRFAMNQSQLEPVDVLCFPMKDTKDFQQISFYEKALSIGRAIIVMVTIPYTYESDEMNEHIKMLMGKYGLNSNVFKTQPVVDIQIDAWS